MEARASFNRASVSKTYIAAVLVVVAMCLAALAGYAAKSALGSGAAVTSSQAVHAAPGTVLRQDNPSWNAEGDTLKGAGYRGGATVIDPAQIPERSTGHKELP